MNINLDKAIELWLNLTNSDPNRKVFEFSVNLFMESEDFGAWEIHDMNMRLRDAVKGDPSMVSFVSLLRGFAREYAEGTKLTLASFLDSGSESFPKLESLRNLLAALPVTDEEIDRAGYVAEMANRFGREVKVYEHSELAAAYLQAKRGLEKSSRLSLQVAQFAKGDFSKEEIHIYDKVFLVADTSDLIGALSTTPEAACIVMAYVCPDTESMQTSFFCFGIRNGENIYLITDRISGPNPTYLFTTRCPSRAVEGNMARARFPYSFANIDLSNRYRVGGGLGDGKALIKRDMSAFPVIGRFDLMEEADFLWVAFFLGNIREKFFVNHAPEQELSYTFAQIDTPLLSAAESKALVPYSANKIELAPVRDIASTDKIFDGDGGSEHAIQQGKHNREVAEYYSYLVNRYSDKINMKAIQPISSTGLCKESPFVGGVDEVEMYALNSSEFFTKRELEYNQQWLARSNFATAIHKLNREDCFAKREALFDWFEERVRARSAEILDTALRGGFVGDPALPYKWLLHSGAPIGGENSLVRVGFMDNDDDIDGVMFNRVNWKKQCCVTGKKPSLFVRVRCGTWKDLCAVLDVERDELPEELQRYHEHRLNPPAHEGNSILDNIDPMALLSDEFNKLPFLATFFFSKNALKKLSKEKGVFEAVSGALAAAAAKAS